MIIYTIRNTVTGTELIGQTIKTLNTRWSRHKWAARNKAHCNPYFQRAWDKYGENTFVCEIIDNTAKTIDELNKLETHYIENAKSVYNLQSGGSGRNEKLSSETRAKLSAARKGKLLSIEHRRKISENHVGMLGKTHSKEARKKMSEAKLGKKRAPFSSETLKRMGDARRGRRLSLEHREKIGSAKRGRKHSSICGHCNGKIKRYE